MPEVPKGQGLAAPVCSILFLLLYKTDRLEALFNRVSSVVSDLRLVFRQLINFGVQFIERLREKSKPIDYRSLFLVSNLLEIDS